MFRRQAYVAGEQFSFFQREELSAESILMSPPAPLQLKLHLMPSRGAGFTDPSEPRKKNKQNKNDNTVSHRGMKHALSAHPPPFFTKRSLTASQHVRNQNNPR